MPIEIEMINLKSKSSDLSSETQANSPLSREQTYLDIWREEIFFSTLRDMLGLSSSFWDQLSANVNISLNIISKHPNLPWAWGAEELWLLWDRETSNRNNFHMGNGNNFHWDNLLVASRDANFKYGVSSNPNITVSFIRKNAQKPWSACLVSKNPAITRQMITCNPDLLSQNLMSLNGFLANPNCSVQDVDNSIEMSHCDQENQRYTLMHARHNPHLTIDMIKSFFYEELYLQPLHFIHVFSNPALTGEEAIDLFKKLLFSIKDLKSKIKDLEIKIKKLKIHDPAPDYDYLFMCETPDDPLFRACTPSEWRTMLSINPNLTAENIANNTLRWSLNEIARLPNITPEIVRDKKLPCFDHYFDDPSFWANAAFCANPNFSMEEAFRMNGLLLKINEAQEEDLEPGWADRLYLNHKGNNKFINCIKYLSTNPNLDFDFIVTHTYWPWDMKAICENPFHKSREDYVNAQLVSESLLSMMDEDYSRVKKLDYVTNPVTQVLTNDYIMSRVIGFFKDKKVRDVQVRAENCGCDFFTWHS